MKRIILKPILFLSPVALIIFIPLQVSAVENYKYFSEAQSLLGPTGNIKTFSAKILPYKMWSFGLHRFFIGINYGALPQVETGISFDLKEMTPLFPMDQANIERKKEEISFHSKYRIIKEEMHKVDIALGQKRGTFFITAEKFFSTLWDTTLQGGLSWKGQKVFTFFSLSQTKSWERFILDYKSEDNQYNVGWRFLLSPEMKLDFFLIDVTRLKNIFFDNFVFGITVAG